MVKEHRAFQVIAAAILATRLAFAFAFPIAQISDYSGYFSGAQRLAGLQEGGLGSWDPIGPKLLYSLPLRVFGPDIRVLGVTNAFVFLIGVAFLYRAARLTFDAPTATVAALISLSSFSDVYFNNLACTEVLAGLFLNTLFYLLARPSRPGGLLALGFVLGLAAYNRSNMVVMAAAFFVLEWLRSREVIGTLRRTALVQGIALLVMLPLCAYNYSNFGRFTPVTSNSGMQVWYGNNPFAGPGSHNYARLPEEFPPGSRERLELANAYRGFFPSAGAGARMLGADPYALSDLGVRYALAWIRANPGRYAWFSLSRARQMYEQCSYGVAPYLFYDPDATGQPAWAPSFRAALLGSGAPVRKQDGPPNPPTAIVRFVRIWYQILLWGAVAGLLVTIAHVSVTRTARVRLLPGLILLIYTAPFLLTIALNRYHVPVMGLLWTYLAHLIVQGFRALWPGAPRAGRAAVIA